MVNSKKIIVVVVTVCILVIGILFYVLTESGKSKYLYGVFEYIDSNGEKSVITIKKDSICLDGIDYESCERNSALFISMAMSDADDSISSESDSSDRKKKIEKIAEDLNYREKYDKVSVGYWIDTNEENGDYLYVISESKDDYGIRISVNNEEKTCILLPDISKIYEYSGKK